MAVWNIIILMISLALFLATEFFFPINVGNSIEKKQKHFLSILIFVFSSVVGFTLKATYVTHDKIAGVSSVFEAIANPEIEEDFKSIFGSYHKFFYSAKNPGFVDNWAITVLDKLRQDMEDGWISLSQEDAKGEIRSIYDNAKNSIFATNVGSIKNNFGDYLYETANKEAFKRGVPVFRIYIWKFDRTVILNSQDENKIKILVDVNEDYQTFEQFNDDVEKIHKAMKTIYSIVIKGSLQMNEDITPDFILVDYKFLAEKKFLTKTSKATGNKIKMKKYVEIWEKLNARISKHKFIHRMDFDSIKDKYPKYKNSMNVNLADLVLKDYLKKVKVELDIN